MEKKEIKKGDFVRMKHYPFEGQICQITEIPKEGMYLTDRCSLCTDAHFEPIDPKTAFLHNLSELLRKHNAVINAGWDEHFDDSYPKIDLDITFDGHVEGICFENILDLSLTADTVFNYDKYDMETNNIPTRIRIEDMMLGKIKEAKSRLGSKIITAIHDEVSAFRTSYNCGDIDIRVTSTIREVKTEQGEAILPARVEYNVDIHFSEEDI